MEWIDPKVIKWDAMLDTSDPVPGHEGVVDVFRLPDGTYEGVAGMTLWTEYINSGRPLVPCVIRRGTHEDVVEASLVNSLNRSRLNPLDVIDLVRNTYIHQNEDIWRVSSVLGRSPKWVKDRLKIYSKADPAVQHALRERMIYLGHAILLAKIEDLETQRRLLSDILTHGWGVKELRKHLSGMGDLDQTDDDNDDRQYEVSLQASDNSSGTDTDPLKCFCCGIREDEYPGIQIMDLCTKWSSR